MLDSKTDQDSRLIIESGATTLNNRPRSHLGFGVYMYGAGAIAFGIIGLVWDDFARPWQPVQSDFPGRPFLAYLAALALLFGGVAVQWRKLAKLGLTVLALSYLVYAVLWLAALVRHPPWGLLNFAEQLTLVIAPAAAISIGSPTIARTSRVVQISCWAFGACAIVFGLAHLLGLAPTAKMVPQWIPPSQTFWALSTGICHLLAGLALLTGIQAALATRLLTAMLLGFGALLWAPLLFRDPTNHTFWAGNAVNLAIAGAAWIMADILLDRKRATRPVVA